MVIYKSRIDLSNLVSFTANISIRFSFKRTSISSLCFSKDGTFREQISNSLFWLSATGGQGAPPKLFCPLKGVCPLKFSKTIERTIETIAYCFIKQWFIVFPPKFFLVESQLFLPIALAEGLSASG